MPDQKQESLFAKNIKFLRKRRKKTQEFIADSLGFTRRKLTAYEIGHTKNPSIEDLIAFSDYFRLSIDYLLRDDLSAFSELKLYEIENSFEHSKGKNLRIVAITVDENKKENIEYVPAKVRAGYMIGYNDPDFIKDLPKASLPFVKSGKTLRMFESEGDSMYPLPERCKVLGEYVEDFHDVKDGQIYIVISHTQGYAIKKVFKRLNNNSLTLHSLNPNYIDYEVYLSEINELWKFVGYYSEQLPEDINTEASILQKLDDVKRWIEKK